MASILDVAREANVAPSTVSLVVNHSDRVKPETRERVLSAIKKLGYRRRPRAVYRRRSRPLRLAFVYTSWIIVDGAAGSYCRELIAGAHEGLEGTGASLSILRGTNHVSEDLMLAQQLAAGEVDGILLMGPVPQDGYLDRLIESGLPMVVFNRIPARKVFSCVTVDYHGGGMQLVDYLVGLGHRRLGMISSDLSESWTAREIAAGVDEAIARHGLEPVTPVIISSPEAPASDFDAACRAVLDAGATAMYCPDRVAGQCLAALDRMGVRVPEDFSVIGFDNNGVTTADGRALTSIGYDKRRMGRMAISFLQKLITGGGAVRWYAGSVATEVAEGGTTAAPPSVTNDVAIAVGTSAGS